MWRIWIKFIFGVVPALAMGLFSLVGITNLLRGFLFSSPVFSARENYAMFSLILLWLAAGAIGALAYAVAWAKEWKGNIERNGWLLAGLGLGFLAALPLVYPLLVERDWRMLLPGAVWACSAYIAFNLWRREYRLPRARP